MRTGLGTKAVFADVESPIALDFLARYPTAASAGRLGAKQMAAFCARHAYSGRRPAAELVARLRAAPAGTTDQAVGDAVLAMVPVLRAGASSLKGLTRSVTTRLGEHPDGKMFTSLPRSGQVNAAQILAEWCDCREAYDSADAVAALAGLTR
jgi:transposase